MQLVPLRVELNKGADQIFLRATLDLDTNAHNPSRMISSINKRAERYPLEP